MRRGYCFGVLALGLCGMVARADVRLPAIISDNMVLQCGQPIPVWGWAAPGEKVTVAIGKNQRDVTASSNGKWSVSLKAMRASAAPVAMTVKGASGSALTVQNVLVGEVWLGAGQSNMEYGMDGSKFAPAATNTSLRLFLVPRSNVAAPLEDCPANSARWVVCNPEAVRTFSAVLYHFGRTLHSELGTPMGLIASSWGGSAIQPWTPRQAVPVALTNLYARGDTGHLYNGMLAPVIRFGLRGALWYQGEANVNPEEAPRYAAMQKAMVEGWRAAAGRDRFPFYFVLLAPYHYDQPNGTQLATMWESQAATPAILANSGFVSIMDIATVDDIHPPNKHDVGARLAQLALSKTYGKKRIVAGGPVYRAHTVKGPAVSVQFDGADGGLVSKNGAALSEFAIAGDDRVFVPAEAIIVGKTVVVSAAGVAKPAAVRFAWRNSAQPNLANKAGWPATPFRTDTW